MAEVALEPRVLVDDVTSRSHDPASLDAPQPLSRPTDPPAPFAPLREDDDVSGVHAAWARVHEAEGREPPRGLAARVGAASASAQRDDRGLIGDLIRANDAVARRCDELAGRVADLEALVAEIVTVVSEDLTHVRALLATPPRGGAGDGTPVGESDRGTSAMDG